MGKKFIITVLLVFFMTSICSAQETDNEVWTKRKKYFNIAYTNLNLGIADTHDAKSKFALGMNMGRVFYLHKKPLLNLMKFGIDASFIGINYANFNNEDIIPGYAGLLGDLNDMASSDYSDYEDEDINIGSHLLDVNLKVGPSLTINPVDKLKVHLYFHYVPTYSMLLLDSSFSHTYESCFDYGASISYKVIGLGIEYRWGHAKHNNTALLEYSDINDKTKINTSALSFYISFRY